MDWLEFWNYSSEDWAGLTFVLVFVALVVAWAEARAAAQLRESETRPYVTIDFHTDKAHVIFLTVANIGRSMARGVTFTIEPGLESAALPNIPRLQMLDPNRGIASLPPGKSITTAFDIWPQRGQRTDLPDLYEAVADYDGEPRRFLFWKRPKHYRDPAIALDLGVYRDSVPAPRKDQHDIHKALVEINKTLDRAQRRRPLPPAQERIEGPP